MSRRTGLREFQLSVAERLRTATTRAALSSKLGFQVKRDLPQLKGEVVLNLYRHGRAWLDGAASAFPDDDNLKNIP
jgi:hypothetical protein